MPKVAKSKVSNDKFGILLVQEDVFQLDVPVYDTFAVYVAQALYQLLEVDNCLFLLQFHIGMVLYQVAEVAAARVKIQGQAEEVLG